MRFSAQQTEQLLALKGVGPTVLKRLEEIGFDSYEQLSEATVEEIVETVASMLRSSCWKNSPQAKAAIQKVIDCAKANVTPLKSDPK